MGSILSAVTRLGDMISESFYETIKERVAEDEKERGINSHPLTREEFEEIYAKYYANAKGFVAKDHADIHMEAEAAVAKKKSKKQKKSKTEDVIADVIAVDDDDVMIIEDDGCTDEEDSDEDETDEDEIVADVLPLPGKEVKDGKPSEKTRKNHIEDNRKDSEDSEQGSSEPEAKGKGKNGLTLEDRISKLESMMAQFSATLNEANNMLNDIKSAAKEQKSEETTEKPESVVNEVAGDGDNEISDTESDQMTNLQRYIHNISTMKKINLENIKNETNAFANKYGYSTSMKKDGDLSLRFGSREILVTPVEDEDCTNVIISTISNRHKFETLGIDQSKMAKRIEDGQTYYESKEYPFILRFARQRSSKKNGENYKVHCCLTFKNEA